MEDSKEKRERRITELEHFIGEKERVKELKKFTIEWNSRISIAYDGRMAYERRDFIKAASLYKKFLQLTARRYNVSVHKLNPNLFEEKFKVSESLLISTLALDLAKIYDCIETRNIKENFHTYLHLFVVFSKGMPFQKASSEALKKYINYSYKIKNKESFKEAYKQIKLSSCFVATAVFHEEAPEIILLKKFRDDYLRKKCMGRLFIKSYHKIGPLLAKLIAKAPFLQKFLKFFLRKAVNLIEKKLFNSRSNSAGPKP